MPNNKIMTFNIQKYNVYDGPGIRTMVFFKGCPLRCKWCSNPEGLDQTYQIIYKRDLCTNCGECVSVCPVGIHQMNYGKHEINRNIECVGCRKCEKICAYDALSIVGEFQTIEELVEVILEDEPFYDMSGGGVTLSGGEATMQPELARDLLRACQEEGVHTAIETCGHTKLESMLEIAQYTDLFLYDLKHMDSSKHQEFTGVANERILENLKELLNRNYNIQIRMPLLKGVNDSREDIRKIADFLRPYANHKNLKGIDLLPYHKFGVNKYTQLDMKYPMEGEFSLNDSELAAIEKWISEYDLPVKIVKH